MGTWTSPAPLTCGYCGVTFVGTHACPLGPPTALAEQGQIRLLWDAIHALERQVDALAKLRLIDGSVAP